MDKGLILNIEIAKRKGWRFEEPTPQFVGFYHVFNPRGEKVSVGGHLGMTLIPYFDLGRAIPNWSGDLNIAWELLADCVPDGNFIDLQAGEVAQLIAETWLAWYDAQ